MTEVPVRVRAGEASADLLITICEPTTSGEVAPLLATAVSQSSDGRVYLHDRELATAQPLLVAGLRAGGQISLAGPAPEPRLLPGWQVAVTGGLDAGRAVPLSSVPLTIGRSEDNDLVLRDEQASRRHAEVVVDAGGTVIIRDLGSANGTFLNGTPVKGPDSAVAGAVIRIGSTLLTVRHGRGEPAKITPAPGGRLRFNRPPRRHLNWETPDLQVPEPPPPPNSSRLPLASMLAPLSAAPIYLITTHRLVGTLLILIASPFLSGGAWLASRQVQGRRHRALLRRHEHACDSVSARADGALQDEEQHRRATIPDPATLVATATLPAATLWEVRPDDPDFLQLRLGVADLPAMTELRLVRGDTDRQRSNRLTARCVPFAIQLSHRGAIGIAGPRPELLAVTRSALMGLVVRHSPAHLRICFLGDDNGSDWQWLKWLPHCALPGWDWSQRWVGLDFAQRQLRTDELLGLIRSRVNPTRPHQSSTVGPAIVVILDGTERLRADRRIAEVLATGPAVGVFVLSLAADPAGLPAETRLTVHLARDPSGDVGATVIDGATTSEVVLMDGISGQTADDVARHLCPLFEVDGSSDPVARAIDSVRHLEALGLASPSGPAIRERWHRADPLQCDVLAGQSDAGSLILDLAQDVHWVVAGMTGSGKSELLRTLIAGLAIGQPPERLALLLIDFKGNSAFRECEGLPHTLGLLSNLDDHLAVRVLDAMTTELTRRQADLDAAGFGSADEAWAAAWASGDVPIFPRLIIVVDELKELTDAYPEAVHRLNQVARIGRSLGVHLVIATQKPSKVAGFDELRSQVDLRICLRVADAGDSVDVIGVPDAARLPRSAPGRGFVRAADATLSAFQGGHLGGQHDDDSASPAVSVRPFDLRRLGIPVRKRVVSSRTPAPNQSDLTVLVEAMQMAAAERSVPNRRRPWLPPLSSNLSLDDPIIAVDSNRGPLAAAIGLLDRPSEARQEAMVVDLEAVGNLLVFGGPRSGRTTVLETLMASLTRRLPPEALHCYGIEGRRHSLEWLAPIEHCGAVVGIDDSDHLERLADFLVSELRRRAHSNATGLPDAHILVLCDGFETVTDLSLHEDLARQVGRLMTIVTEGPAHAMHVVVTTDMRGASTRWLSSIDARIVLRPNSRDDQLALGLPYRPGAPDLGPGRGYLLPGPVEVQVARGRCQPRAPRGQPTIAPGGRTRLAVRVDPMPAAIGPIEAEARRRRRPPAGPTIAPAVGGVEISPLDIELSDGGVFVIGGPRRSGRSTALLACVASLALPGDNPEVVVVAARRSPLAAWPGATHVFEPSDTLVADLSAVMNRQSVAIAIDDAELLSDHPAAGLLSELVRASLDGDSLLFLAGTATEMCRRYSGWIYQARQNRLGMILHPSTPSDGDLLDVVLPRTVTTSGRRPPGRGVLVMQGVWTSAQVIDHRTGPTDIAAGTSLRSSQ